MPTGGVIGDSGQVDSRQWDERYSGGPQEAEVLYTAEAISAELSGLRVLRADHVHRTVERDGVSATAIDTLVRAVRDV